MAELTPEDREKLRPCVESGFLSVMEQIAKQMTAPYWWRDPTRPDQPIQGGTLCFVNTGARLVGITAAHIHRAVMLAKANQPLTHGQVGGHSFDPERALVDIDDDLDIVVYALSEIQAAAARAHVHSPYSWPPTIDDKQAHIVGGWLWNLAENQGAEVTHYFAHYIAKLTDVTDRSLIVSIGTSTSVPWGKSRIPPGTNLGGMSGGPIYRLQERPLVLPHMVGITSEYHQGLEFVPGRPLSLVGADGRILRP